jgi:hypothetical protein
MIRGIASFAGIGLGAALGLALAGCSDAPLVQTLAVQPSVAQLQAIRGVRADYVYYPDYEIYYSRNYQQYVYRDNCAWVTRKTAPASVPAGILSASRSVPMHFQDDPPRHHADVVRMFPRNHETVGSSLSSNR